MTHAIVDLPTSHAKGKESVVSCFDPIGNIIIIDLSVAGVIVDDRDRNKQWIGSHF